VGARPRATIEKTGEKIRGAPGVGQEGLGTADAPLRILGVDPGSNATGFGVIERAGGLSDLAFVSCFDKDVVEVVDMETAPVGDGEVLIDVEAASINPSHLLTLSGDYGVQPDLPAVPGAEGIGMVVEVGIGVEGLGRESWFQGPSVGRDSVDDVEGRFEDRADGSGFENAVGHHEADEFAAFFRAFLGEDLGSALGQIEQLNALIDVFVRYADDQTQIGIHQFFLGHPRIVIGFGCSFQGVSDLLMKIQGRRRNGLAFIK